MKEKPDLVQSELIRFYCQEMIYNACVEFRNILWDMVTEGLLPVDISVNVLYPSEHDVEKYKQVVAKEEE